MTNPVLTRYAWEGTPRDLGVMWSLHKGERRMHCRLSNHPVGWELRLDVDGELVRSQVCRAEGDVFDLSDEWRTVAVAASWVHLAG
jgi:hypothetical protein